MQGERDTKFFLIRAWNMTPGRYCPLAGSL